MVGARGDLPRYAPKRAAEIPLICRTLLVNFILYPSIADNGLHPLLTRETVGAKTTPGNRRSRAPKRRCRWV